jgi:ABC-type transport system substrate-binding protein
VIPLLGKGTFVNWMAWTNAVNSPDPRLDLLSLAASTGSQNWNHINNPALDKLLADAAVEPDTNKAKALDLQAQDILLKNAQYGGIVLYNYISRSAIWNYIRPNLNTYPTAGKPGAGWWNTAAGALTGSNTWFNPKDPTYTDGIKSRTLS